MLGAAILLSTPDARGARRMAAGLRCARCDVAVAHGSSATFDLIEARAVDLVLVDHRDDRELAEIIARAREHGIPALALSAHPEPAALVSRMHDLGVSHVIAASIAEPDPLRTDTISDIAAAVTAQLRGNLFGIANHLGAGLSSQLQRRTVAGGADRELVIGEVCAYLEQLHVPAPLAASLALLADELTANALAHGDLPIELTYGSDGATFAVSVLDHGGTLTAGHIASAMDLADDGGGLGLMAALHCSSRLIFNLAPGRRTEVIAVAELRQDCEPAPSGRSLQVCIDRPAVTAVPVPRPVELSASLRQDLRSQLAAVAASSMRPGAAFDLPPRPRRRPRATPNPLGDVQMATLGLDTLRGILRGAASRDAAIESSLRFLARDCRALVAYQCDGRSLLPLMAAGRVARWYGLGLVEPWLRAPSTPAIVARDCSLRTFAPEKRGIDRRIYQLVGLEPGEASWALPITLGGEVELLLCAFAPRPNRVPFIQLLLEVRAELEQALERLAVAGTHAELPAVGEPAARERRARTEPPYAELVLLDPRAATAEPYAVVELDG